VQLSIIMPFLNSHEIVRRQLVYMKAQQYPDDVEIIFLDDGSDPPIEVGEELPQNFRLHTTNEFRPWTSSLARNLGATLAKGKYLFLIDGDYILTREAVERARNFEGDRLGTRRRFGVLDPNGELRTDSETLLEYGLVPSLANRRRRFMPPHPNQFVMRKTLFEEMGGYDEQRILTIEYPQREDNDFKRRLSQMIQAGTVTQTDGNRPEVYMFPNGQFCGDVDYNPFDLFHELSRKTDRNFWYSHNRYKE